jgi:hypothetical protein
MKLFGSKKQSREERDADTQLYAEELVSGKGIGGKLTRGIMGKEFTDRMTEALQAGREGQAFVAAHAAATASGQFGTNATITSVTDTGKLVNSDPIVVLSVTLVNGQALEMETMVSKLQIPRVGDSITLIANPAQPGAYVYGGLAF